MRGAALLLLVLGACGTAEHVLGPTTYDVNGVWRFDQILHNTTLQVSCGSQGNITVAQDGPRFTATGLQSGYCDGPGGSQGFTDEPFAITNGAIDGATVTFKDSECSYRGTAHGAKPDSVSGTATCRFNVDNQTVTLTGTWDVIPPPDDVFPTLSVSTLGGGTNGTLESGDDTLYVHIVAADNIALRAIGYEIRDPSRGGSIVRKDSLVLSSNTTAALDDTLIFPLPLNLPLPVGLDSAFQGSAFARDTAGHVAQATITPFVVHYPRSPVATGTVTGNTRPDSAGALRDTLDISVTVHSPRPLRYVGYRLTSFVGMGDSVAVTDSVASHSFRLPIPFAWKGIVLGVEVFGRDRLGLEDHHQIVDLRVAVFPSRPTATFRVGQAVSDVVYDPARGRVYLATALDSTVQTGQPEVRVFQFSSMSFVTPGIQVPWFPSAMDLSPGGDSLVLTLDGHLGIINLNTLAQDSTAPIPSPPSNGRYPGRMRAMANGKAIITLGSPYGSGAPGQLLGFDLATQAQAVRQDAGDSGSVGFTPEIARSPDRTRLIVYPSKPAASEAQLYLAASDSFTASVAIPAAPIGFRGMSSNAAGSLWLIGNQLLDGSLAPLRQLGTGIYAGTSVLSYDGLYAYGAVAEGVAKFRTSDGVQVELILLQDPPYSLSITPDGNSLIAISGYGLQIVDLR